MRYIFLNDNILNIIQKAIKNMELEITIINIKIQCYTTVQQWFVISKFDRYLKTATLKDGRVSNSRICFGKLFQSLAAEYWKVLCPIADLVFGKCSSELSLNCLPCMLEREGRYYTNCSGHTALFTIR